MRTIKHCQADDLVMHPGGNKYRCLARLNSLVFLSESYDHSLAHYHPFTVDQLVKEGWKLLVGGKEPMSKEELEHLMPNVKII